MIRINDEQAVITLDSKTLYFKNVDNRIFLTIDKIFDGEYIGEDISHLYPTTISCFGRLDYRERLCDIELSNGRFAHRFIFKSWEIVHGLMQDDNFPHARNKKDGLLIKYIDKDELIEIEQYYYPYEATNTIVSFVIYKNISKDKLFLRRTLSLQLDLPSDDYYVTNFTGKWAKERNINKRLIKKCVFKNASTCGASSAFTNPAIMLNNDHDYYLFNLIYSGNHLSYVDQQYENVTRVVIGINDYMQNIVLNSNESFATPEATLTFANDENELRNYSHHFITDNILKPCDFPIIFNAWEAAYFNLTKEVWLKLAPMAERVGANIFVFDDGWFGNRNDETSSLGDWDYNSAKMGEINELTSFFDNRKIKIGIWIEPEMVSHNSKLFEAHPEYALKGTEGDYIKMRHQFILDLVNDECRNYITNKIINELKKINPSYIKWDFNRLFTDVNDQNYIYRYYCALYKMCNDITAAFPHTIFEGCASGGTRFDLGMLYYFPVIWTSDGTDALDRIAVQDGTSLVYPISTSSNHISCSPNHQTHRKSSLQDRINVAMLGRLGLELNLLNESKITLNEINGAIKYYLKHRDLIVNGDNFVSREEGVSTYGVISSDKSEAIYLVVSYDEKFKIAHFLGLEKDSSYRIALRKQSNVNLDVFPDLSGKYLEEEGITLSSLFNESDRDGNELGISTRIVYLNKNNNK